MNSFSRILFVLTFASLLSTAQNMKPTSTSNTQANAKFAQMSDEFVKDSLALSPVNA
jgi:hypothetical protein